MDLGLNITHLHEMVQLIGETPYAGQLSQFYFESGVTSPPPIPITVGEEQFGEWTDYIYGSDDSYICGA